jgi:uncharacterized protein with NRDE domain
MCTLIVASNVWKDWPLVIAANRDEQVLRPSAPPSVRSILKMSVLAPTDLKAGGTWLGLNAAGLIVGITNRFGTPADTSKKSRGALVFAALANANRDDAVRKISDLNAGDYNGFHLLIADTGGATVLWSDGQQLSVDPLESGVHVLTERSYGAGDSARLEFLQTRLLALAETKKLERSELDNILRRHAVMGFEGTCVHLPEMDYATRSSTIIQLGQNSKSVRFFFADGPPCMHPYDEISHEAVRMMNA